MMDAVREESIVLRADRDMLKLYFSKITGGQQGENY